jgi:hypothetical protein
MRFNSAAVVLAILLFSSAACTKKVAKRNRPEPPQRSSSLVPAGTLIKIRTASLISSRAVAPGERIEVELAEPLEVEGTTKIPAGATAVLSVVDSKPGVPLGTASSLLLKVTQLRRSLIDHVEVNTTGVQRDGPEIAPGSVLTFKLATPARLATELAK